MAKLSATIGSRIKQGSISRTSSPATERVRGWKLQQIRARVLRRDRWLCRACLAVGRTTIAEEIDHIVPLYEGGQESDENRQSLCKLCHLVKSEAEEGRRRG